MCPIPSDVTGRLSVSGQQAPQRADAARNRERILAAARAALTAADDINAVTMQSVAQQASIGQGTLYRHFPTREDLVLAVYHADVERLIATAAELSASHPPREAMRRWLVELAALRSGQARRLAGCARRSHPPGDQRAMAAPGARRRAVIARRRSTRWRATRRSRCRRLLAIAWLSLARATARRTRPATRRGRARRPHDPAWMTPVGIPEPETRRPRAQCGPGVSRMSCDITRWS